MKSNIMKLKIKHFILSILQFKIPLMRLNYMKSLIRFAATLGLISSTCFLGLGQVKKAMALPEDILEPKLSIPVFAVTDTEGAPLVATDENGEKVTGIFISLQAAQNFLQRLQIEQPDLGNQIQVTPLSLHEVRDLEIGNESEGLDFRYIPMERQIVSAFLLLCEQQGENCPPENLEILQGLQQKLDTNAQNMSEEEIIILRNLVNDFEGVPVFVARGGEDGGYLTVRLSQDDDEVIPIFFEQEQLEERVIQTFQSQYPTQADTVAIEVITLEGVIDTLANDDSELLRRIVIVPSQETLQLFVQEEANNNNNINNINN